MPNTDPHPTLYVAYGSNHSPEQMARRCPGAKPAGRGELEGYRLVFAGPLTIEPCEGAVVPVSVWTVTPDDIARLDRYEGWPRMYRKANVETALGTAFVYIMNHPHEELPWGGYYDGVALGYDAWGFDLAYLEDALDRAERAEAARYKRAERRRSSVNVTA
jgi:gamma-glutamylcyclotransferase (GGCT)/AIG2-like uncharacterized protein YtfP